MATAPRADLSVFERNQKVYKSGNFADATITVANAKFRVISTFFAMQSPFFEKAFFGKYREAKTKVLDLSSWDQQVVRAMIQYVYTSYYTVTASTGVAKDNTAVHAKIYALGSYVDLPALQDAARTQFESCMERNPRAGFASASIVYGETEVTDRKLRDTLVFKTDKAIKDVFREGADGTTNLAILRSIPELSYDLAIARVREDERIYKYQKRPPGPSCVGCRQCREIAYTYSESLRCPECWTVLSPCDGTFK